MIPIVSFRIFLCSGIITSIIFQSNHMCVSMELVTAVLGDHGQRPRDDYGRTSFLFLRGRLIDSLIPIHYSLSF